MFTAGSTFPLRTKLLYQKFLKRVTPCDLAPRASIACKRGTCLQPSKALQRQRTRTALKEVVSSVLLYLNTLLVLIDMLGLGTCGGCGDCTGGLQRLYIHYGC